MTTQTARRAEVADEISKWTVGGGIIVMVLFPLALPIIALTAFAALPLLAPVLAVGVLIGLIAAPITLGRRLGRALRRRRGRGRSALGQQVPVGAAVEEQWLALARVDLEDVAGQDQVIAALDQVPQLAGHPHQGSR